jgi:hypothetical protein
MRKIRAVTVAVVLALLTCAPAPASELRDAVFNTTTTDVTLVTTAETVVITSDPARPTFATSRVLIIAWGQLTLGTSTTAVTPRIRRGTTTSGTLIGEANSEAIKTAAASTEPFFIMTTEQIGVVDNVQYVLTLAQTAASANGSCLQASIIVLVL